MSFDARDQTIIHTVTGRDKMECLRKIEEQCGRNYQVHSYQDIKIRSGFLGLHIEDGIKMNYSMTKLPSSLSNGISPLVSGIKSGDLNFEDEKRKIIEMSGKKTDIKLEELTKAVQQLSDRVEKNVVSSDTEHSTISKIEKLLEENEFSFSYIKRMLNRIRQEFPLDDLDDFDKVEQTVIRWIGESINVYELSTDISPTVVMLVGPTGIGKTTTVAKLTCKFAFASNSAEGVKKAKEVRIITSDCYKIGAEDQIKKYCDYMELEYDKIDTNADFNEVLEAHKNTVDLFIVDTSGYSQKDSVSIGKMRKVLDSKRYHSEVVLCMSASTKISDMLDIMQQYEPFSYNSIIITKLDETNHVGNVISAIFEKGKAISYITDGQKVPQCIKKASVSSLLLELTGFNVDAQKIQKLFGPIEVEEN
mgnify:CR=1 FL=1